MTLTDPLYCKLIIEKLELGIFYLRNIANAKVLPQAVVRRVGELHWLVLGFSSPLKVDTAL